MGTYLGVFVTQSYIAGDKQHDAAGVLLVGSNSAIEADALNLY